MESRRIKIIECEAHDHCRLWVRFEDGLEGEVNLNPLLGPGVFAPWDSVDFFNSVYIHKETGTVTWGENLDLDPNLLYQSIKQKQKNKIDL